MPSVDSSQEYVWSVRVLPLYKVWWLADVTRSRYLPGGGLLCQTLSATANWTCWSPWHLPPSRSRSIHLECMWEAQNNKFWHHLLTWAPRVSFGNGAPIGLESSSSLFDWVSPPIPVLHSTHLPIEFEALFWTLEDEDAAQGTQAPLAWLTLQGACSPPQMIEAQAFVSNLMLFLLHPELLRTIVSWKESPLA